MSLPRNVTVQQCSIFPQSVRSAILWYAGQSDRGKNGMLLNSYLLSYKFFSISLHISAYETVRTIPGHDDCIETKLILSLIIAGTSGHSLHLHGLPSCIMQPSL